MTNDPGVLDSDLKRHSIWRSRDFESQMLVEILRLSRLTVLYGAEGAGKTTLLKTGVLPLLRLRADDRRAQDETGASASSTDRQTENRATDCGSDVAIIFDRWENAPLIALLSQIRDALGSNAPQLPESHPECADSLAAWNTALGVRLFIILDGFEQHLRAPLDRPGIADFDDELVRIINAPGLPIHFLLSVRDDAEGLLSRFRGRICGLEDTFLRLPRRQPVASLSLQSSEPDGPTRPVNASKPMRGLLGRGGNEPTIRDRVHLYKNTQRALYLSDSRGRAAATRSTARAPRRRHALRFSVRRFIRISVAAVVAGLVIGVGAGYFTVSQNHSARQAASSPGSPTVAAVPATDPSPAPVIPAMRADPPAPSPPQDRVTAGPRRIPRPDSPTPIQSAKGTSAARDVAARIAPPKAVSGTSAAVGDWRAEMQGELEVCRREGFLARVMCTENVRWKHCAPDRWNRIPECATGNIQTTSSD